MNYFFPNPSKQCNPVANEYIKDLIYKNKLVLFSSNKNCLFTKKLIELFIKEFNTQAKIFYIDSIEDVSFQQKLKDCIVFKSRDNIVPKVYINGMYMGNHKDIEDKMFRKDLDIFF